MPVKAKHPCNRCRVNLTTERYCSSCLRIEEKEYDQERGTSSQRGYTATWRKVRTMKINTNPLCERCLLRGRDKATICVHHKDRNPLNNDFNNLESLCFECHQDEHKEERWRGRS